MRTNTTFINILFLLLFIPIVGVGQEKIVELEVNPVIRKFLKEKPVLLKSLMSPDTLELPFFDDFSRETIYPSPDLWEDQDVYVNFGYGVDPPSIGVATFDVLDSAGLIYDRASTFSFIADHLTSKPINLDGAGTDVFLSFYYQPMGIGDFPQIEDSLFLEFFSPVDTSWTNVWSVPGTGKIITPPPFKHVIIPVSDTKYLKKGFKFRYFNYASITTNNLDPGRRTNCDHWNLDYIYLDKSRFPADTVPHDVVVSAPLLSLLKNYEAMPWRHFRSTFLAEMGSTIPLSYINQDSIVRNVTRNFEIYDEYMGSLAHSYTGGAFNIGPWDTINYKSTLIYTYDSPREGTALFSVKAWLVTDDFDRKINDTVYYLQHFGNYFAYDDGTAEAGYDISGDWTENQGVACQFNSFIPDTLRAIQIFFGRSYEEGNDGYFHLVVWDDDNGKPGNLIYSDENLRPGFRDSLNIFYTYNLKESIFVNGMFYIGWIDTSPIFLNVGYDRNRNKSSKMFYQKNGIWYGSSFGKPGALMIRPVVASGIVTGLPDLPGQVSFNIYPNPASNVLKIGYDKPQYFDRFNLYIYDSFGRKIKSYTFPVQEIDISALAPGLYIIEIKNSNRSERKKFLKISH